MKTALPLSLAFGGLSLVMAAFGLLMFYVNWVGQPSLQAIPQPAHSVAASVAAAQDLPALKVVCQVLAQSKDAQTSLVQFQSALLKRIAEGMSWFLLVWGSISGVAFLYIHFLLRRRSSDGAL